MPVMTIIVLRIWQSFVVFSQTPPIYYLVFCPKTKVVRNSCNMGVDTEKPIC